MAVIKRALISVSDKTGVAGFARGLARFGVTLLSTGGTARLLRESGLNVTEIGAYTGFPELLDGRVKTLHPKVHAGILARRDVPGHMAALERAAIPPIDLVVVNLYPFGATVARPECTLEQAIENIDIGGPTMLRSAAKNHAGVAVLVAHLHDLYEFYGEHTVVRVARKHISWYTKGLAGSAAFRHALNQLETRRGQLAAVDEFFAQLAGRGQRLTYAEELAT